jgi:uncharacterized membrane protein (DUF485 family)
MSFPSSNGQDLTPISASPTDIAPIATPQSSSPDGSRDADRVDWKAIESSHDFVALLRAKAAFVAPATAFFMVYYFLLPIGVGWFPKLMDTRVIGVVNLAYLFALSQFVMAWILAFLYVGAAAGWDRSAAKLIAKFRSK